MGEDLGKGGGGGGGGDVAEKRMIAGGGGLSTREQKTPGSPAACCLAPVLRIRRWGYRGRRSLGPPLPRTQSCQRLSLKVWSGSESFFFGSLE